MANYGGDATYQTYTAGTSLAAGQHYIVTTNGTAGEVMITDAATDVPIGVLVNKPAADQAATVQTGGVAKVISNGATVNIAVGDYVGPGADGKAYKRGTADTTAIGIARQASSADGTIIEVIVDPTTPAVIT